MKMLYTYNPENTSDTSITITASSEDTVFDVDNLKSIEPVKSWKSTVITDSHVNFDFGSSAKHANILFLNRINFAGCTISFNNENLETPVGTYTDIEVITGMATDEITDEQYIKYWVELGDITFRHIKITIPSQTPLFEQTYFKIGNALFGFETEIWTPKAGFYVDILPKISITEFGSGYISTVKRGRTRRQFVGTLDKITMIEYNKLSLTLNPMVMYNDFENDKSKCYLVRSVKPYKRDYFQHNIVSHSFTFEELI